MFTFYSIFHRMDSFRFWFFFLSICFLWDHILMIVTKYNVLQRCFSVHENHPLWNMQIVI